MPVPGVPGAYCVDHDGDGDYEVVDGNGNPIDPNGDGVSNDRCDPETGELIGEPGPIPGGGDLIDNQDAGGVWAF